MTRADMIRAIFYVPIWKLWSSQYQRAINFYAQHNFVRRAGPIFHTRIPLFAIICISQMASRKEMLLSQVSLSQLCLASYIWTTFWRLEQLFAVLAATNKFCLSEHCAKYRPRVHIKHEKMNADFIENLQFTWISWMFINLLKSWSNEPCGSNYCEERNTQALINVFINISKQIGKKLLKFG